MRWPGRSRASPRATRACARPSIVDAGVRQRVHEALPFAFAEDDLSAQADDALAQAARLDALLAADLAAPFDLARGPLWRVRLVRLAADRHVLSIVMHHIVCDGWSLAVFARELEALYSARRRGRPTRCRRCEQYPDYAAGCSSGWPANAAREAAHWRETLAGAPPAAGIADRPPASRRTVLRRRVGAGVDRRGARRGAEGAGRAPRHHPVHDPAGRTGAGAVAPVRTARRGDRLADRRHRGRREVQDQIGFFVNMLALRLDLDGDPDIATLLARTKATVLAAQERSELPFEQVVEQVNPARSLARTPVFQVAFAWAQRYGTGPAVRGADRADARSRAVDGEVRPQPQHDRTGRPPSPA